MFVFSSGLLVLIALPAVLGGEIPVIDGVPGGVPSNVTSTGTKSTTPTVTSIVTGNATIPAPTTSTAFPTFTSTSVPTPGKLRGVVENSGICETTKRVAQASGYADLTATSSIWFWYFAARSNPDTAPLTLWFNGGPGSSSMYGLFQEIGPCRITSDGSSVTLNPYSWNTISNVIFIDQPIGTGFSHGTSTVSTSTQAAADVWNFMQIFLSDARFRKFRGRRLQIWTESYGGHYGPVIAEYFYIQNLFIIPIPFFTSKVKLNLKVLGIGNGVIDALSQYPGYISYAKSNPYHELVSPTVTATAQTYWSKAGGCSDQIKACYNGGTNAVCSAAQLFCNNKILAPLHGIYDEYYVPTPTPDPYPPEYTDYLESIRSKIGAEVPFVEWSSTVYDRFAATGDWMRNSRPILEFLINAGIRTVIYAGDADYIVNYQGVEAMVDNLNTKFTAQYKKATWRPFLATALTKPISLLFPGGQYKCAGTFAYIRFYGAGHMVPAYKYGFLQPGQAALEMFKRATNDVPYDGCT